MKNKKLIKSIKSDVKKQIEFDIKNSIVKELKNSSNKQIKKLRKQILAEVKEEMFGYDKSKSNKIKENLPLNVESETTEKVETNEGVLDYRGFKFNRKRMSSLVVGNQKPTTSTTRSFEGDLKNVINKSADKHSITSSPDYNMMQMLPTQAGNFTEKNGETTFPMGTPTPPKIPSMEDIFKSMSSSSSFGKSLVKCPIQDLTDEKKDEISFFIKKLKDEVSKLRKDEKNIKYRKKFDNTYFFEFERKADFDLKFNIELNLNTYGADIKTFEFKIDDFRFDKRQFELIDIIIVLDIVGFNINGYINEIKYINEIDMEHISTPTTKVMVNKKSTSKKMGIEKIILDSKIVKLLKENEISNLGQLLSVDDLTSLKGIGTKTINRINEYLKSNTYGVL